ncbi:na+-driven multidrug efflux pump [Stylonychia lemnae]|uniref:Na+-driven multidrug efflux pump n=1 Tax=Stylonychia lemnae TaxID=5949 RepID=A0A078B528_STYLE|nr:na+-driven multidrug efflux pump [Stylonychia lemnae]|eukprot:CDW88643.1 na+-driven multidrug efflux pump [Stylonychia lemnae]
MHLVKSLFKLSIPVMLQSVIFFLNQIVNLYFSGYDSNPAVVAGVGLGSTFINVAYFGVCFGLNGVLQSLVSQAMGADNHRLSGIYVNRGRFVISLWLPIVIFFTLFLGKAFISIGIDDETANVAQNYTVRMIPGLIAYMYYDIARQYLIALGQPMIAFYIQVVTALFHIVFCFICIEKFQLPYYYTSYSTSLQFMSNAIIIHLILLLNSQYKKSWFLGGMETFQNLGEYTKLAIPSAIMLCIEFAGFEILCIVSGFISVPANAAQVIALSINGMFYMIPAGISQATTTIIGKLIGQQQSRIAKAQSCYIIKICYIFSLIMGGILFISRYHLARLFSSNIQVTEITQNAIKISCFSHMLDFVYGVQLGTARALTKFNHAVFGGIVAFYIFACPLGSLLALQFKFGVFGLWIGLIVGQLIVVSYFQYLLSWGFDWDQITQKCFERQQADNKNLLTDNENAKCFYKNKILEIMQVEQSSLEIPEKFENRSIKDLFQA